MTESAPVRGKVYSGSVVLEEESETPSGIQSDTPDGVDVSSASQSLPTRDYTSSSTPTATSTLDNKKTATSSAESRDGASSSGGAAQETSAATGGSVAATGEATMEDGVATESVTTTREGGVTPSELKAGSADAAEKEVFAEGETVDRAGTDGSEGEGEEGSSAEVADKEGVADESGGGVANGIDEDERGTGTRKDDKLYKEETPIESMPGYLPWDKDSEMLSCYQERKDELSDSYKEYVTANPELFSILADFLQALFIQKPSDVFSFARDFFQPFARDAPHLPSHPTTIHPDGQPPSISATTGTSGDEPSSPHGTPTINLSGHQGTQGTETSLQTTSQSLTPADTTTSTAEPLTSTS